MPRFPHRIAAGLIALTLMSCPNAVLQAQQHDSTEMKPLPQAELDVVKVLLAQERAWNKGDIEGYASGYANSPDTIFMSNELDHGYESLLNRYKKNYPDRASMGMLSFSDLQPRVLDDHYAIVTGRFTLERDKKHGGAAGGIFSLVFEKTAAGWKIILDHTT
jgi:ketosteroid isomerase-like protein